MGYIMRKDELQKPGKRKTMEAEVSKMCVRVCVARTTELPCAFAASRGCLVMVCGSREEAARSGKVRVSVGPLQTVRASRAGPELEKD